ncbi:hypothetical protein PILCRDRAFT_340227 [Piloderma croceum F 1598]|uniref:Heme haloperoxidase family profile domain-containing protein n=1 Tax=Piloderma croceum (strain F 1598) TaxID=765440 RepID=A0A0C3C7M4_PILCF|nr:hypothetical protein PILCRDRAFT_340227 [Piloderma croceum F 1598]
MQYSILLTLLVSLPFRPNHVLAFPQYGSLAGLSSRQLAEILPTLQARTDIIPPPGPMNDTSTKLVNDKEHPYIPPGPDDIRGPCPAMNTLANHGYIPRNGIARPSQIVAGVQEAFNMGNDLAKAQVYGNHILNGNLITDLLSIGRKTSLTGPDPPSFSVGGLNKHNTFEGDASVSRADFYFGDNHSYNETVFEEFIRASRKSVDGRFDSKVLLDLRYQRFKDSIATNPTFNYLTNRYFAAYQEGVFTYMLFVDGLSKYPRRLDMDAARSFFQFGKMPDGFHRANQPLSSLENAQLVDELVNAHPNITTGQNNGTVNSFTAVPLSWPFPICLGYKDFVEQFVPLYPNVTGDLRKSLEINLHYFYEGFTSANCTEIFL